ncbi:hypothetical protein [Saccharothrix syringae]|uniref:Uncharacterized protein n=1 Tax=Saccharothrix syringae TaxID=103733 RepID=A0A5Q0GWT9_SACSY|nr:hypothetical protein [Saccharothrix syringae]QFZ18517.1 hypothetical protein EKG83_14485 [Saccharothrix syringae]
MRAEPTDDEKFAFALVKAELGVDVDPTGEQIEPGHVDAILNYPDGRQAAMEVTMLVDKDEQQLWKLLKKRNYRWKVSGSSLWWHVSVGERVRIKEFDQHIQEIIQVHEAHGVTRADQWLPHSVRESSPALRWLSDQDIEIWGHANDVTTDPDRPGRHAGAVTVTPRGRGGAVPHADAIPEWLNAEAATEHGQLRSKIDKLARTGLGEQHLFLVVDFTGATFGVAWLVADDEELPTTAPQLGAVTHLWMTPTSGKTYLRWNASDNWERLSFPALNAKEQQKRLPE